MKTIILCKNMNHIQYIIHYIYLRNEIDVYNQKINKQINKY